jgi:hypothetical protein
MEKKLAAGHGKYKRMDFLMSGSIWDQPREWMQSFLQKERVLMTEWSSEHGSTLGSSVKSVALVAQAMDEHSGYIAIEYSFENSDASDAELAELEDGNL